MQRHTRALCVAMLLLAGCADAVPPGASGGAAVAARHLPRDGRVLFIMGQDSETLAAYKAAVLDPDPDVPRPGGVTLYTNLSEGLPGGVLGGLVRPADYGVGPVSVRQTLTAFPEAALVLGLTLADRHRGCANVPLRAIGGLTAPDTVDAEVVDRYRGHVDTLLTWLAQLERPVFLRIGYEFDGPWNCYRPEPYKAAFRYIARRIEERGIENVATVWQTAAWPRHDGIYQPGSPGHLAAFYPGDEAVDWVGLSRFYGRTYDAYQWRCGEGSPEAFTVHLPPPAVQDGVLHFARARGKPVMIAEAAPQGFQVDVPSASCLFVHEEVPVSAAALWDLWYRDLFDFVEENRDVVRAVAYINADWNSQRMWHCAEGARAGTPACPEGYWGDSRVEGHPEILRRFKAELQKPIYVHGRP